MASFYADENVPGPLTAVLRGLGHDVLTVQDEGLDGIDDPDVLARAVQLGRPVLTKNRRDLIRLHRTDPNHTGIVFFGTTPTGPPSRRGLRLPSLPTRRSQVY